MPMDQKKACASDTMVIESYKKQRHHPTSVDMVFSSNWTHYG